MPDWDLEQSPNYHVLIPRLSLSYRTERWTHTFSYQCFRRNPAYSTLSTAVNYRSKYEYQTGNPYLRPTTTHYVSWTTNYRWVHAELYYQYIKNLNYSFQVAYDDTNHPGVILDDRRNVPQCQNYGLEINVTPKIGIWQMNYSADFYFNNRDLEAIGIKHKWNGLGTYFNLDNTLSLPHDWLLNIRMELQPYNEQGCSQTKTTGGIDLRLSHQFLKDKRSVPSSRSIAMLVASASTSRGNSTPPRAATRVAMQDKVNVTDYKFSLVWAVVSLHADAAYSQFKNI